MDKLDMIKKNFINIQEQEDLDRKEIINQLYDLRKNTLMLIDIANVTLQKRRNELNEINKTICLVQGHSYNDWEEHSGVLDRTWFYTRKCEVCGMSELVENEPVEFREQQLKRTRKK